MMDNHAPGDDKPWYRQFWPWFVILIPALTVVAGITTVFIAMDAPSGMVVDDYYKQGLAINRDLARSERARELGLTARVSHDPEVDVLIIELLGSAGANPGFLNLHLSHPTLPDRDQQLSLVIGPDGRYRSPLNGLLEANWHLEITSPDDQWRMVGRMRLPGGAAVDLP